MKNLDIVKMGSPPSENQQPRVLAFQRDQSQLKWSFRTLDIVKNLMSVQTVTVQSQIVIVQSQTVTVQSHTVTVQSQTITVGKVKQ